MNLKEPKLPPIDLAKLPHVEGCSFRKTPEGVVSVPCSCELGRYLYAAHQLVRAMVPFAAAGKALGQLLIAKGYAGVSDRTMVDVGKIPAGSLRAAYAALDHYNETLGIKTPETNAVPKLHIARG